jgi:predicted DNA-binding protein
MLLSFGGKIMKFVVEMTDDQHNRLEKILGKSGTTIADAIADFFDDLDDTYTAEERIAEIEQGLENSISWSQVREQNGLYNQLVAQGSCGIR